MEQDLKIIQLSDCHVSAANGHLYRGIDPRLELEKLLPAIEEWCPDLILLTGDLAEDASEQAYSYLAEKMAGLGVPVVAIPGNHDDPETQARFFPETANKHALIVDRSPWRLILLNSAWPRHVEGRLSQQMLASFKKALAGHDGPVLVALHHQPVKVGSAWIDKYALAGTENFWHTVNASKKVRAILWGHVHQQFHASHDGVNLLGCPSSAINSLPGGDRFSADGKGPACRWVVAHADGSMENGVFGAG